MGKIFLPERNFADREFPPPQIVQNSRVRGKGKRELIGVKRLPGLVIAPIGLAPAVLSVSQQRAADLRHGYPDLMGAARQKTAFHQGEGTAGLQRLIKRDGGFAARGQVCDKRKPAFCARP